MASRGRAGGEPRLRAGSGRRAGDAGGSAWSASSASSTAGLGDDQDVGPDADPEAVARQILLRRLTDQPRSRAELADTLRTKRVPDDLATRMLDRFEEVGLIDDTAFAQAWVQSRHAGRGLGRRALQYELRRKGVSDDVVTAALAQLGRDAERETARRLAHRRRASMGRLDPVVQRRRLAGLLARRGYSGDLVASVLSEEFSSVGADGEETPEPSLQE